ncbi:MAG: hypothetical protein H7Z42_22020, partial [Roseiflexaceae bacterium]|nr:hypothetical protein [Roseiflexaceae bacterium]
ETAPVAHAVPHGLLDEIDSALRELVTSGVSDAPQALIERLRRLDARLRAEGLIWPADTLAEIVQHHAAYTAHDARFTPSLLAALVGEVCARLDAIRANTGAVPQLFVRGSPSDRETPIGTARLIGLGCDVRIHRGGVELAAYLQDADSGALVVVRRAVAEPEDAAPASIPFWQLAQPLVVKGAGIAALGGGQVLIKGGKRLPNGAFLPGRAQLSLNQQAYAWESLRAPVLAEDFAELTARIAAQPPTALRPRRLTDGLYVCAVAHVEHAAFDPAAQVVRAVVVDSAGRRGVLVHPYTTRGKAGAEAMLAVLADRPGDLRFVAGHVRLSAQGLMIAPTALVFQDGTTRIGLLPWVAREQASTAHTATHVTGNGVQHNLFADYWVQVGDALGDLLVVGVQRADDRQAQRWRALAHHGAAIGFGQTLRPVEQLAHELEAQARTVRWNSTLAAQVILELACLCLFVDEIVV